MKFRSNSPDEPELNLIPMIDVLLMTLIFLVVTTSFSKEAQLHIKLPESSADAKIDDASLRITIDAKGQYFINDRQLLNDTFEVLRRTMLEAAGGKRNPVVVIYADAKTPHQAVVRAMDAARRLGYTHLTFATQQYSSDSALP
jgi:biopolymer transport protein ExbD